MDESNRAKIRNIKSKVVAMLEERYSLENRLSYNPQETNKTSVVGPSKYWSDFCLFSDYMLGLSEESFAKLRLHTYHLTGDYYQTYYFGDPESFLATSGLESIIKDLPSTFIINEPEGGIGFHYANGRFLSRDILNYQKALSTFYRYGVLPEPSGVEGKRSYVLEIGGGYGGLAHHFSNIYKDVTYIIVDLPETLLFSASYLSLLNPQKKIYIYEKDGFQELLQKETLGSFDFILLPNYVLNSLADLRFDLVINQASFQEMHISQVEIYLDFIKKTCKGVLYSWNLDRHPLNKEMSNLSDLLGHRFDLLEVPDARLNKEKPKTKPIKLGNILKAMIFRFKSERLSSKTPKPRYREYICKPLICSD